MLRGCAPGPARTRSWPASPRTSTSRSAPSAAPSATRSSAGPPGPDLDLVVEGDALALAERLGRALEARVTAHERFGTAALALPHGRRLDLVGARRERYPEPGALPGGRARHAGRRPGPPRPLDQRHGPAAVRRRRPAPSSTPTAAWPTCARGSCGPSARTRSRRTRAGWCGPRGTPRGSAWCSSRGRPGPPGTPRTGSTRAAPGSADELRRLLEEPAAPRGIALLAGLGVPWLALAPPAAELEGRFAALDAALARPGAPALPAWALRLGLALGPAARPGRPRVGRGAGRRGGGRRGAGRAPRAGAAAVGGRRPPLAVGPGDRGRRPRRRGGAGRGAGGRAGATPRRP